MDFYYGTSVVEKAATMVRTFPKESATKDDVEKLLDAVISNIEDERLIAALRESTGLRRDFTEFERHFMDYLATLMNQRRVTSIRYNYNRPQWHDG